MRYASRKFILAALTLVASCGALYLDLISMLIWRDVVLGTVGVYITGNVAQKTFAKEPA